MTNLGARCESFNNNHAKDNEGRLKDLSIRSATWRMVTEGTGDQVQSRRKKVDKPHADLEVPMVGEVSSAYDQDIEVIEDNNITMR